MTIVRFCPFYRYFLDVCNCTPPPLGQRPIITFIIAVSTTRLDLASLRLNNISFVDIDYFRLISINRERRKLEMEQPDCRDRFPRCRFEKFWNNTFLLVYIYIYFRSIKLIRKFEGKCNFYYHLASMKRESIYIFEETPQKYSRLVIKFLVRYITRKFIYFYERNIINLCIFFFTIHYIAIKI